MNNFASCSKTNFKSLLVTADFIVNNRGAREPQDLSPISPSRKSSRPPPRRSFNTVTRLHKIFRSAAHIRVRDPNFPRYPAVDTKEEDSRRKISPPPLQPWKKQGCASCMIYRPFHLQTSSPLQLLLPTFEVTSRPLRFLRHFSHHGAGEGWERDPFVDFNEEEELEGRKFGRLEGIGKFEYSSFVP